MNPDIRDTQIAGKELFPIIIAAAVWGRDWSGKVVRFNCDNEAVVEVIKSGSTKDNFLSHLLRCLFFIEAKFQFVATAAHVPGVQNTLADALSRDNWALFHCCLPQADRLPTPIPTALAEGLLRKTTWTAEE